MRWPDYSPLREFPQYKRLSYSRREVLLFLWQRADDDGVVRRQVAIRRIGERLDMPRETVRKALTYLANEKIITRVPGSGRRRSVYVVPVAWDRPLTDPDAPRPAARVRAGVPTARTSSTSTTNTDAATGVPAAGPQEAPTSTSGSFPWRGRNDAGAGTRSNIPGTAQQQPDENDDDDRSLWCERARAEGARHRNKRCCHSTSRQLLEQKRARDAARARAAEEAAAAERRARQSQDWTPSRARGVEMARAETRAGLARARQGRGDDP